MDVMPLSALTDSNAVVKAIEEFDRLGREAFLDKYGFKPASYYFVSHQGNLYDSKALAGAALAYQSGVSEPMPAAAFSGGAGTVVKKMEELGFEIVKSQEPAYWAFCANPNRYRILDAVAALETDLWGIENSDIRKGDGVAIWQTKDKLGHRGIVALGEVISEPAEIPDVGNPYWVDPDEAAVTATRVHVRYSTPQGLPLWLDDPGAGDLLANLSVAKSRGGTVFKVTSQQWQDLVTFCGPADVPNQRRSRMSADLPEAIEPESVLEAINRIDADGIAPHRWTQLPPVGRPSLRAGARK